MDKKLLDILVCPASKQSLSLLNTNELQALNLAIDAGQALRADGSKHDCRLKAALITRDRRNIYPIEDGIPVMLIDQAIAVNQLHNFPKN